MALSGIAMPDTITPDTKKEMHKSYAITFVGSLLTAYVLAHVLAAFGAASVAAALQGAFWVWLGFFVPAMLGMVLWEGKPWKYYTINVGYYLVSLCIVAIVLTLWR